MITHKDWVTFTPTSIPLDISKEILERIEAFIDIEKEHYKLVKGETASETRRKITPGIWGEGIAAYYFGPMVWDVWVQHRLWREETRRKELAVDIKKRPARVNDLPLVEAGVKARVFRNDPHLSDTLFYDPKEMFNISTGVEQTGIGKVPEVVLFGYIETDKIPGSSWNQFSQNWLEPICELREIVSEKVDALQGS